MIGLLTEEDYRSLLRNAIVERKASLGRACSFQNVAKACRIPKTYLSTVLRGNGHLSSEQVFLACDFLGLTPLETDFALLLLEHQRAVTAKRRQHVARRLAELRQSAARTEAHIASRTATQTELSAATEYYLDPVVQVVHVALTCPRFAKEPTTLATALELPPDRISAALAQLGRLGLIEVSREGCRVLSDNLHLARDSTIYPAHRRMTRMAALERFDRNASADDYSFAAVFTCDRSTRERIHSEFLKFLKGAQRLSAASPATEVHQMIFDLVRWTR